MVALFAEGASYTGEEAAELFCHGGPRVLDRVLRACLDGGARAAAPGEFTRRALARGRLDLIQAEAVALLAEAATDGAVDAALSALAGRPSAEVAAARETLLDALAEVEASLDFEGGDGVVADPGGALPALEALEARMDAWLDAARAGRPALAGYRVVLAGAPNAGKSSLFNALLGRDRAIVHDLPGTTRDVVTEAVVLGGAVVVLTDTAGLRDAPGHVEAEGVHRARAAVRDADLVLELADRDLPESLPESEAAVPTVRVRTKCDLDDGPSPAAAGVFRTSAATGEGVDALRRTIAARAAEATRRGRAAGLVVAGERQVEAAGGALQRLRAAIRGLEGDVPLEVVASDLRGALAHLGAVDGREVTEEVLDRIFRRFCVGK
jgi:tRNA modification GTPase